MSRTEERRCLEHGKNGGSFAFPQSRVCCVSIGRAIACYDTTIRIFVKGNFSSWQQDLEQREKTHFFSLLFFFAVFSRPIIVSR